jgi:hypothetical protein
VSYDRAYALDPEIDFLLGSLQHTKMHLCMWDDFSINIDDLTNEIEELEIDFEPLLDIANINENINANINANKTVKQLLVP